ncbi:MAG: hypothetical protein F6K54_14335 [Okeania sp. SIO3B5]|nr:element excision factor XisH family protein [Okeania sp. SIO3B5]NEO54153.1 hypothetical protein [Okeania sp. SIO3B5]
MPAKDIYHECVKKALIKDEWVISVISYQLSVPLPVCAAFRKKVLGLKY